MPLVAAKCTQCGANLQIDSSKDAAICPNCNTPFVTEKAITNYKTYYEYKIEKADVHIHDEKSVETRLKNAEIFFKKHNNIDKAYELFHSVANDAPGDYRGWWGLVRVKTNDFDSPEISRKETDDIKYYANCAFNVAPSDMLDKLEQTWRTYNQQVYKFHSKLSLDKEEWVNQLLTAQANILSLESRITLLSNEIIESDIICKRRNDSKLFYFIPTAIILGVISLIGLLTNIFSKEGESSILLPLLGLLYSAILAAVYVIFKCIKKNAEQLNQEKKKQKEQLMDTVNEYHKTKTTLLEKISFAEKILS